MEYFYPFGETVRRLVQQDRTPKQVNPDEAREIISKIHLPSELGSLEPTGSHLNGPSAKVLDEHILAPLGYTRKEAWLCDLLPETRLNNSQVRVLKTKYEPRIQQYGLNPVTIPKCPTVFCDINRCKEILAELKESRANLLVLLGDIPIRQFLNRITQVNYSSFACFTSSIFRVNEHTVFLVSWHTSPIRCWNTRH